MRRSYVFVFVALTGCAVAAKDAGIGNDPDAGGIQHPDGNNVDPPDAAPIPDAPPGITQQTLSQNSDNTLLAGNSLACPADTVGTGPNIYYRVFDLQQLGITTDFTVNTVSFQVEDCESTGANGAPIAVHVGTYTGTVGGTLDPSLITVVATNSNVQVPEVDEDLTANPPTTPGSLVNAPITATVPGGSKLVIEVDAPDGNNNYQFYIGSNMATQSANGYVSSTRCSPPGTTPSDPNALVAGAKMSMLLTATGTF